jgi:hypothetical protein
MPKGSICRIADLEIAETNPSATALASREVYAKTACTIFLPIRSREDLFGVRQEQEEEESGASYWDTFVAARDDGSFWETGLDTAQH